MHFRSLYHQIFNVTALFVAVAETAAACTKVDSFDDIRGAIDLSQGDEVVLLCPFSVQSGGVDSPPIPIWQNRIKLICAKSTVGDRCVIEGGARHLEIMGDGITVLGFDFIGSKKGSIGLISGAGSTIIGCNFQDNDRTSEENGQGGALEISQNPSNTMIYDSNFEGNKAISGGSIFGGDVTVLSSSFTSNEASGGYGGAMKIDSGLIRNSSFLNNQADFDGPVVYTDSNICANGMNYACHGDTHQDNTCDGIFSAGEGGVCESFAANCEYASVIPTSSPTLYPTKSPSKQPTNSPTMSPTKTPTLSPTAKPTKQPTLSPSSSPTLNPSKEVTTSPTFSPSLGPSKQSSPTLNPSKEVTTSPSFSPSLRPSKQPTNLPTSSPTSNPSKKQTHSPTTISISAEPTPTPTLSKQNSSSPTIASSMQPTLSPTSSLSSKPSLRPANKVTPAPTKFKSMSPSTLGTNSPIVVPTKDPSTNPSLSLSKDPTGAPSESPRIPSHSPSSWPIAGPSSAPTLEPTKILTITPSSIPTLMPSATPSDVPTATLNPSSVPTIKPTIKYEPSLRPTQSLAPSSYPSSTPTLRPTKEDSKSPSKLPSVSPTSNPTSIPTESSNPSNLPSYKPSPAPSLSAQPTLTCNMSKLERARKIELMIANLNITLSTVAQNEALVWLIQSDPYYLCPDSDSILQRYAAAVVKKTFQQTGEVSSQHECDWDGIFCDEDGKIIKVNYSTGDSSSQQELPKELYLLENVEHIIVQNSNVTGEIPSEIFGLQNLIEIDLDKNVMAGEITPTLNNALLRLDINFNRFSGSIDFLTKFPQLMEAHLDNNGFSGTIPSELGSNQNLQILTLHGNSLTGTMPQSICNLRTNGVLKYLMADCGGENPKVICNCCTHCSPYRI